MGLSRPPAWQFVATLIATLLLVGLGAWQLQRMGWKHGLIAERAERLAVAPARLPEGAIDPAAWNFRAVAVEGVFRHDLEQQLFGRSLEGETGWHVLTPLESAAGMVLIDRGWVPYDKRGPETRASGQAGGTVRVEGIARAPSTQAPFVPDNNPVKAHWYWIDLAAIDRATGISLRPVIVEAGPAPNTGGYPVGGQTSTALADNHLAYAVTWFSLAIACLVVFGLYWRKRVAENAP